MYRLNDEQQQIADRAAAVADRELAPRAADVDRNAAFPQDSHSSPASAPRSRTGCGRRDRRASLPSPPQ